MQDHCKISWFFSVVGHLLQMHHQFYSLIYDQSGTDLLFWYHRVEFETGLQSPIYPERVNCKTVSERGSQLFCSNFALQLLRVQKHVWKTLFQIWFLKIIVKFIVRYNRRSEYLVIRIFCSFRCLFVLKCV